MQMQAVATMMEYQKRMTTRIQTIIYTNSLTYRYVSTVSSPSSTSFLC